MNLINLSDNNAIPQLGLGTWMMSNGACAKAVKQALDLGYTHIDTAEEYKNEEAIGRAIKDYDREQLFITSKVWHENLHYEQTLKACENSLQRLKTDYLDLYLIHWPNKLIPIEQTLSALKELQKTGKIKSIGVSNFTQKHLDQAMPIAEELNIKIVINQVEFHAGFYQKDLLEYCDKKNIKITAYSPLAQGLLATNPLLASIGQKYNKSAAQIALIWLIQRNLIVIPKALTLEYAKANMEIFDIKLEEQDMADIDGMGRDNRMVKVNFAEFYN
ncbi:MAG: aldo/keto reductase [bacterium]